jgi:hypothetical protein
VKEQTLFLSNRARGELVLSNRGRGELVPSLFVFFQKMKKRRKTHTKKETSKFETILF